MHPSAFSPVKKSPCDEMLAVETDDLLAPNDDDLMPISVAIRLCPEAPSNQSSKCLHPLLPPPSGTPSNHLSDLTFTGSVGDNTNQRFHFDHVFTDVTDQKCVFNQALAPLLALLFDGYDVCVLAYGQAGGGKSYTLAGPNTEHLTTSESEFGLIIRSVRSIFQTIYPSTQTLSDEEDLSDDGQRSIDIVHQNKDVVVRVSFIDVDNEDVHDLLSDQHGQSVRIGHDREQRPVLEGLTEIECTSIGDVWTCYKSGEAVHRLRQASQIQPKSHTIFNISLIQFESKGQICKKASLRFVEVVASDQMFVRNSPIVSNPPPVRQQMAVNGLFPPPSLSFQHQSVDLGLLSLGNVVTALADPRRNVRVVAYQDSLLTQILCDAFGGTSITLVVCCVSSSLVNADETLNTLKFASWVAKIKNRPVPNVETIAASQAVDDVEEEELLRANFSNSRRESELSELQRGLRSVSATDGRLCYSGGHMPDLVNNSAFAHSTPFQSQNNNPGSLIEAQLQIQLLQQQQQQQQQHQQILLMQQQMHQQQLQQQLPLGQYQQQQPLGQYQMFGNNLPYNQQQQHLIQTLLLQQQQQQQQHQILSPQMLSPTNFQTILHQQQPLQQQILPPQILTPTNFQNKFTGDPQVTMLNHYYQQQHQLAIQLQQQQQLALQQQLHVQTVSPFVPIQHRSPFPEDVSPLSQQKSPLNVGLYLPLPTDSESGSFDVLSPPDKHALAPARLEPNTAVIPLSLPSLDGDNNITLPRDSTPRKSDTRRSSLASQIKLTRIVEESEHDVSINSSKEMAAQVIDFQLNAESDGSEVAEESDNAEESDFADDDESDNASDNEQDEEDFDSDCSAISDLDPKLDEFVEKFRKETVDLITQTESAFFELEPIVVREKRKEDRVKETDTVITDLFKLTLSETNQSNEQLFEQIVRGENPAVRHEIQNELKKLSSLHESKMNSFEQSEVVLSQVQIQLSEIKKSIKVKDALLHELARTEKEMKIASRKFQKRLRALHEESSVMRKELREAQKSLIRVRDSDSQASTCKRVETYKAALVDLQKKIEQTEEGARMMIIDETESVSLVEADLDRMRHYQAELQSRLSEEQQKKETLQYELEQDRETIEQLELQLLAQGEQVRLSLQLSQELENRKSWLSEEESRLEIARIETERVRIETETLQQSLVEQQMMLQAREQVLNDSLKMQQLQQQEKLSLNESRSGVLGQKNELELREEVTELRAHKSELVEERYELVHNLEHFILDRSCKHCVVAAQRGFGSEAAKRQGASTSQDKWRASEIDVCMEAIDFAIDYKQNLISDRAVDYVGNSDNAGHFLMEKLCQLSLGEVRALLHKFVLRMIDLRVMGEHRDSELKRLSEDALSWIKHAKGLQNELSVIHHTNQRKMDNMKREFSQKLSLMARSSRTYDNDNGNDEIYEEKLRRASSELKRYKDMCRVLMREREMLKHADVTMLTNDVIEPEVRKVSDAGSSDTSARVQRFRKLAQTMKNDEKSASKVTRHGKKLIIEQTTNHSAGNSFDLSKISVKSKAKK